MNKTTQQILKANEAVDNIISDFDWDKVYALMILLDLRLPHPEKEDYTPTIKQLIEHATLLLDSVASSNKKEIVLRTLYFAAYNGANGLQLLFTPFSKKAS